MPRTDTTVNVGALASFSAGLEFYRGWGSYQDDQAWQLRTHEVFNLWQFTPYLRFLFAAHQELTASPYAQAGFNPRTARWEEQFLLQGAHEGFGWTAGFFHRCKHDVDNNEPPDDDTSNQSYQPIKRAVILTGITARIASASIESSGSSVQTEVGLDYYLVSEDYRSPGGRDTGSWKGMQGALVAQVSGRLMLDDNIHLRTLEYLSIPFFTSRYDAGTSFVFDARAELSVCFQYAARFEVVAAVDHQFDELVFLTPHETTVYQVGIRLSGF